MRIDVLSLFPEFFAASAEVGVVGRAIRQGLLQLHCHTPRDYTRDRHRRVDDRTFGGGPGMVMQVEPLREALTQVRAMAPEPALSIYLSPQGERLTQARVRQLAELPRLLLLCGRYEGVDERLVEHEIDLELSIGDYVLSGGELAAAVLIDAVGRLQEGALNRSESAAQDSFEDGLLDCPHYSRPEQDDYGAVPQVLMSGDHVAIERWRRKQALGRTWLRRPDLLARKSLTARERALLEEFRREWLAEQQ
ncbi:MAG: tRNA (guanosine(37)-N1)-methyltransferase TrmD [Aquimonas sp.]|nr:tRNA (guanosine(37)-N1)-methyltransferase TrmD [Aquimonas sp.]